MIKWIIFTLIQIILITLTNVFPSLDKWLYGWLCGWIMGMLWDVFKLTKQ